MKGVINMVKENVKVERIRAMFRAGYTVEEIAKTVGLSVGTIQVITNDLK